MLIRIIQASPPIFTKCLPITLLSGRRSSWSRFCRRSAAAGAVHEQSAGRRVTMRALSRDARVGVPGQADCNVFEPGLRVGAFRARRAVVPELADQPPPNPCRLKIRWSGSAGLEEAAAGVLRVAALGRMEDPAARPLLLTFTSRRRPGVFRRRAGWPATGRCRSPRWSTRLANMRPVR